MLVDVGSARLFFDVVGESLNAASTHMAQRPTLILLHGGPGYDHSTLRPYFDRYSDAHQLIYLDHRGCGRSTGKKETWYLDQWADDLAVVCGTLGIYSPAVFGQSFGGMVAMHYAARHPTEVSKLILSSTAAQFRLDETVKMMNQLGGKMLQRWHIGSFPTHLKRPMMLIATGAYHFTATLTLRRRVLSMILLLSVLK